MPLLGFFSVDGGMLCVMNGIEVHLRFNEGSYFSEKSGLINFEKPQFSMAIADTSFLWFFSVDGGMLCVMNG